jgi:hypothetical protein
MDDRDDDLMRFNFETSQEAHYWFTVSDFVDLSLEHGIDKVLADVIQLRLKRLGQV